MSSSTLQKLDNACGDLMAFLRPYTNDGPRAYNGQAEYSSFAPLDDGRQDLQYINHYKQRFSRIQDAKSRHPPSHTNLGSPADIPDEVVFKRNHVVPDPDWVPVLNRTPPYQVKNILDSIIAASNSSRSEKSSARRTPSNGPHKTSATKKTESSGRTSMQETIRPTSRTKSTAKSDTTKEGKVTVAGLDVDFFLVRQFLPPGKEDPAATRRISCLKDKSQTSKADQKESLARKPPSLMSTTNHTKHGVSSNKKATNSAVPANRKAPRQDQVNKKTNENVKLEQQSTTKIKSKESVQDELAKPILRVHIYRSPPNSASHTSHDAKKTPTNQSNHIPETAKNKPSPVPKKVTPPSTSTQQQDTKVTPKSHNHYIPDAIPADFIRSIKIPKRKQSTSGKANLPSEELEEGETLSPSPSPKASQKRDRDDDKDAHERSRKVQRRRSHDENNKREKGDHRRSSKGNKWREEDTVEQEHRKRQKTTAADERPLQHRKSHQSPGKQRQSSSESLSTPTSQRHRQTTPATSHSGSDHESKPTPPSSEASGSTSSNPSGSRQSQSPSTRTFFPATAKDSNTRERQQTFKKMFEKLAKAYKRRGDRYHKQEGGIGFGIMDYMNAMLNYMLSFYYHEKLGEDLIDESWDSLMKFISFLLRNEKELKELQKYPELYAMCLRMSALVHYHIARRKKAALEEKKKSDTSQSDDIVRSQKNIKYHEDCAKIEYEKSEKLMSMRKIESLFPDTFHHICVSGEFGPGIDVGGEAGTSVEPMFALQNHSPLHLAAIMGKCIIREYTHKHYPRYKVIDLKELEW